MGGVTGGGHGGLCRVVLWAREPESKRERERERGREKDILGVQVLSYLSG